MEEAASIINKKIHGAHREIEVLARVRRQAAESRPAYAQFLPWRQLQMLAQLGKWP